MGKSIIVKGADFSAVAIDQTNLFNPANARRNYAVYASNDSASATVTTYNGFCVCEYIQVPQNCTKILVSNVQASGAIRFRFSKTTSDSESVPQNTGLAGLYTPGIAIDVPSDPEYIYFVASIFRGANAEAAANADLTDVTIEALR